MREREDAMGAYLMMFAAVAAGLPLPIINLIASVIYYYINKSSSRFVHFHALQSLLSQIPVTLVNAAAVFWTLRIVFTDLEWDEIYFGFIGMTVVLNLLYIIFSLVAAVRARKGRFYYFLFFGKLAYRSVYLDRQKIKQDPVNLPPKL